MFYVKEKINGEAERIIITDENVYCECPHCMTEQLIDISEIISSGGDLFSTSIICPECARVLKDIERDARELAENAYKKGFSVEILAKAIEGLVLEYWSEVLHRDTNIEKILGVDDNEI